jgi:hypothetical protein
VRTEGGAGRMLACVERVSWQSSEERGWLTDRLEDEGAQLVELAQRWPYGGAEDDLQVMLEALGFSWPFTRESGAGKASPVTRRRQERARPKKIA